MFTSEYIAGFFDGEGCIYCAYVGGRTHYKVSVFQKHLPFIESLHKYIGFGKVRKVNAAWALSIENKQDIIRFLVPLVPYLILRKTEAELMIQICSVDRLKGCKAGNDPNLEEHEKLYQELRTAFANRKEGV